MYKLLSTSIIRKSDDTSIPRDSLNSDYQSFLQDVKREGISIVEGEDARTPDYSELRRGGYAPIGEQLDMQYKNDGTWDAHIAEVKAKFPKTITGGTTIAPIPDWVQEEADKAPLAEQV
jgi:hypothetical protein